MDRLDYSKGILHRLWGFAAFLEHHPEYRGQVTLAMVIVPSRDHVGSYAELKTRIDEEIGSINGKYSTMDWTPVCYFYHGFAFEELAAMYCVADVALVTPLRDGMNLVAKEYIATKTDNPGVLILSEMAGAAVELSEALQINPNDIGQIERSLVEALTMPVGEQRRRIRDMQRTICTQTVDKWAADFLEELEATRRKNERLRRKRISVGTTAAVRAAYGRAKRRLLLFDYDGTLAALRPRPEDAAPTPELLDLLRRLSGDPANRVVINSGRDHETLERWFGSMPLSLAAEHGGFYKEAGVWHKNLRSAEWDGELLTLLQRFVAKTPRARLETKQTALAWHYRQSDAWLGSLRAQQLVNHLAPLCSRLRLQIMQGDKVVEIKSPDCTKGLGGRTAPRRRTVRLHPGPRRRHDRRRHVPCAAARSRDRQGGQRLRMRRPQPRGAGRGAALPARSDARRSRPANGGLRRPEGAAAAARIPERTAEKQQDTP